MSYFFGGVGAKAETLACQLSIRNSKNRSKFVRIVRFFPVYQLSPIFGHSELNCIMPACHEKIAFETT